MPDVTWNVTTRSPAPATKNAAWLAPCWKGDRRLPPLTAEWDGRLGGTIGRLLGSKTFDPARGAALSIPLADGGQVVLAGMGTVDEFAEESVRSAAGRAAKAARSARNRAVHVDLGSMLPSPKALGAAEAAACIGEAVELALYRFSELKTADENRDNAVPRRGVLRVATRGDVAGARRGLREGQTIAAGARFSRTLVNRPANLATPRDIAAAARALGRRRGKNVRVTVLTPPALERLGMGAMLSVGRGSNEPARLVVVDSRPQRRSRGCVVLVGKTVTFDSGGLSLKPGKGMETMKGDMAGGAAVLGAVDALAALDVPVRVVAILPAVENMPGGTATRPGDVVTSMSGLTVEVLNTDAEGRLTLADGLAYAGRFRPDVVVDIATLTGACMVAVGPHRAGLFCEDARLRESLVRSGDDAGERLWPLPLDREYDDLVRSDVADVKNISGGREGGAIVAAVFLRKFVPDGVAWAHLDIAGREFSAEDRSYGPKGATGFGARLLTRFVRDWAAARGKS